MTRPSARRTAQPRTAVGAATRTLSLRRWLPADAAVLIEISRDPALRHWIGMPVMDMASARRWIQEQQRGWDSGSRLAFAVIESTEAADVVAGHVVLKRRGSSEGSDEVGYWTAPQARGRGVAPRALRALTDWAFATYGAAGPRALDLVHQVDNVASCRVAQKCGFELVSRLAATPPEYPLDGHVHRLEHRDARGDGG